MGEFHYMGNGPFDLGEGFSFTFTRWAPDREIPSNNEKFQDVPDIERFGIILKCMHGTEGLITFEHGEPYDSFRFTGPKDTPRWDVIQLEPLTLHPSVDCGCCHGFIRNGRWCWN